LQRYYISLVLPALFAVALPLGANDPPPATPEQERLSALVEEGVLPRTALAKAARERESERLEEIVRNTLASSQLLAGQIPEMMRAVTVLRDMAREDLANALKLAEAGALPLQDLEKTKDAAALAERRYELAEKRAQLVRELALIARAEDDWASSAV
jgi:hypothetical protein